MNSSHGDGSMHRKRATDAGIWIVTAAPGPGGMLNRSK
jgi:hypothetical protein